MLPPIDPRERAFEALLQVAPLVHDAVDRVQALVTEDDKRNARARAAWTHPQRAAATGYARFSWTVAELNAAFRGVEHVVYISRPTQEAQNMFLWMVAPRLTLRVKRDPLDLATERTQQLFSEAPAEADQTACLTWRTRTNVEIDNVSFASAHGEPWSITLAELLAALRPANVVSHAPRVARVSSARSVRQDDVSIRDGDE